MSSRLQILCLLIGLQLVTPAPAMECGPALRKVALLTVAPLTDAEKYVYLATPTLAMTLAGAPRWMPFTYIGAYALIKTRFGTRVPSTARGVLNYLTNLRLLDYDFSGKNILDVGAGFSRFAQAVDMIYRGTGTQAIALDKQVQPYGRNSVKADATAMPFKDDHFDLVVSSWAYTYWHGSKQGIDALDEMIRVSKSGGQIKLRVLRGVASGPTENYLTNHPDVESYSYQKILTATEQLLVINLKKEPSTQRASYHQNWLATHQNTFEN